MTVRHLVSNSMSIVPAVILFYELVCSCWFSGSPTSAIFRKALCRPAVSTAPVLFSPTSPQRNNKIRWGREDNNRKKPNITTRERRDKEARQLLLGGGELHLYHFPCFLSLSLSPSFISSLPRGRVVTICPTFVPRRKDNTALVALSSSNSGLP